MEDDKLIDCGGMVVGGGGGGGPWEVLFAGQDWIQLDSSTQAPIVQPVSMKVA